MATYKVPQDVEAEDKLLGPFSFRQFIYLIIASLGIALAWGLSQIFIGLAVIPLPIIALFGILALPLRKDQPMEIYLAAIISFYRKPHKRLWEADGVESLIEITAPKTVEVKRTKDISQDEAEERFGYLAEIVDSQGWAVRGQGAQAPNAMTTDAYYAAQQAQDVLEQGSSVAQSFEYMITQSDAKRREEMVARMHTPTAPAPAQSYVQQPATPTPVQPVYQAPTPQPQPTTVAPTVNSAVPTPTYNPYPSIQQAVVQPTSDPAHRVATTPPPTTSEKVVSADIMRLANNTDLSIETIAREANRIQQKQDDLQEEVVISLR